MNTDAILIDPDGIYDDGLLCGALGVSAQTLARARHDGQLRFSRKGKRILYLGRWVLDWLQVDTVRQGESPSEGSAT